MKLNLARIAKRAFKAQTLANFAPLFIRLLHYLLILSFGLLVNKISHQMAMRNSIHDVVDVQSLVTRNQLSMLQYCTVYIDGLVQDCSNSSDNSLELLQSCTKPSISRYESYRMLLWGINIVFWVFGMLLRVIVAGTLLRVVIVLWQISGFNIKDYILRGSDFRICNL